MVIVENITQNTPEWDAARLGIPTGSAFKNIVTSTGAPSKSREKYLFTLAGEKLSGEKQKGYYSNSMAKGHEREDESRQDYSFRNNVTIEQPGFCFFDEKREFGCSPDGLIGEDGTWETKNAESHVQIDRLENGWSKVAHYQQVQGALYVTGRKWCDLVSFSRGIKPIVIRFERDENFIHTLSIELKIFIEDLNALVGKYSV